ncbi:MAG: transglycosylase domain-containing protein [Pikeienuella sp.]
MSKDTKDKTPSKPKGEQKAATKKPRRQTWLDRAVRAIFWWFVRMGLRIAFFVGLVIGCSTAFYYITLPPVGELFDGREKGSVTLLDRRGDVFAWRGDQYGGDLRAGDASPHLVKAITAAEDRRFYSHFGLDPRGLARAMVANVRAGRFIQGGSTLTQQVAKNVFLTSERTIQRKLKEIPVALALEWKYSKDEILSIYLNRVYLGAGTTGFEAAAQRYFGKSARVVNLSEAAMLAGLLKAPSRFAPTTNIGRSQGRASVIINAMRETGVISKADAARALANPAQLSREAAARTGAHFADWVMEEGPTYLTAATGEDVVISTTFDPRIQAAAESALAHVFDTKVRKGSPAEAAIVVMNHQGAVRAIVGGRDPRAETFNRATQALRQTGSAFKPIVYAAAMERGFGPFDTIVDEPLTMKIHGKTWSPRNYNGRYQGPMTLADALTNSVNTVAVRLSERTGRKRVQALAVDLGLTTPIADGPAVALGVSEATLLEMTSVYAAFANGGRRAPPSGISEIRLRGDDTALMSADAPGTGAQVISPDSAAKVTAMMRSVIQNGTGKRADLGERPAAGKTGTTQGARDAWFIGYTADYVIGVWMGKDDNAPLKGVTGGGLPADIWRETALRVHEGVSIKPLKSRFDRNTPEIVSGTTSQDESIVQSIFKDVVTLLGGNGGGSNNENKTPPTERIDR